MIPEPDDMIEFARSLERAVHTLGWDEPSLLGLVIKMSRRMRDGPTPPSNAVRVGDYAMSLFPTQPGDMPNLEVGEMLTVMARHLSRKNAVQIRFPELVGKICGAVLVNEAWMNTIPPDERDGRRLADIPGSKEVRNVSVIDCGGRAYFLQRIRGQAPTIEQWPDPAMFCGRVPEALRDILLGMTGVEPDGEVDVPALRRVATYEQARA